MVLQDFEVRDITSNITQLNPPEGFYFIKNVGPSRIYLSRWMPASTEKPDVRYCLPVDVGETVDVFLTNQDANYVVVAVTGTNDLSRVVYWRKL